MPRRCSPRASELLADAATQEGENQETEIRVVLNWFDELKRIVPPSK